MCFKSAMWGCAFGLGSQDPHTFKKLGLNLSSTPSFLVMHTERHWVMIQVVSHRHGRHGQGSWLQSLAWPIPDLKGRQGVKQWELSNHLSLCLSNKKYKVFYYILEAIKESLMWIISQQTENNSSVQSPATWFTELRFNFPNTFPNESFIMQQLLPQTTHTGSKTENYIYSYGTKYFKMI